MGLQNKESVPISQLRTVKIKSLSEDNFINVGLQRAPKSYCVQLLKH